MTAITVRYSTCDRAGMTRRFKSLKGAQKFAHEYVGAHPEIGRSYAVSGDGIGKVTVDGCTLAELFPWGGAYDLGDDLDDAYEAAERSHRAETRAAERIMAEEWEAEHGPLDGTSDYQRACEDGSLLEWELSNGDW